MPIRRIRSGKGHRYVDRDTGEKFPGVTTIIRNGVPKPKLDNWRVSTTIDYAVDHWNDLSHAPISERIKRMSGARFEAGEEAKARGTEVHRLAAHLVIGDQVDLPEGLEPYVLGYVAFLDAFDVQPILVETTVVNYGRHYAGTLDLIADLTDPTDGRRERWLLDLKTSGSGIYGETALQLAGYRYAEAAVDEDGVEFDLPEVDRCGAVWIQPKGSSLVPIEVGDREFDLLLYAVEIADFVDNGRDLIGAAIEVPKTITTYRLERTQ